MRVTEAILRGFRDVLRWNVLKIVLITGIPLAIVWLGIAAYFWQPTVALAERFIGWVPFSILKANGAFLIGGFFWFAAVLITFALIISLFNVVIFRFLDEKRYTTFSILLILLIALGWTLFAFLNWDMVYVQVEKVLAWFPFETLQAGVGTMLAALIFYNLFIATLSLVVLAMRHSFLRHLQERDYPYAIELDKTEHVPFWPAALRDLVLFFLFLALFFPLLFVPFVNVLVQVLLWAWLIREAYFLSAASYYVRRETIEELKRHEMVLWGIAFIASLLNLIPVINLFAPFLAQIIYFHWVMLSKEEQ